MRPPFGRLTVRRAYGMAAFAFLARALAGEITYDPGTNRITVAAYREKKPATLSDVLAADRRHGWGKVDFTPGTGEFSVRADLWIGTDRDYGTFFQIGRSDCPRETLVLHGDLVVCAPAKSGQRQDGRYRISNRLTMGDPGNADVRATVKIACSRKNEFSVRVLAAPQPKSPAGRRDLAMGEWFMFHSTLTAATPGIDRTYAAAISLSHTGVNYRMADSTISWWDGGLFKTVHAHTRTAVAPEERVVRGMLFENGGSAHGSFPCADCVFRNVAVGRIDSGATRCLFEENRVNLQITPYQVGVVLLDCELGAMGLPSRVPRSERSEKWLRSYSVTRSADQLSSVLNPGVFDRVSLLVEAVGGDGRPIPRATVTVECAEDRDGLAISCGLAVTDENGLTPGRGEERALVVTRRELRPTNDPAAPEVVERTYRLRVSAPGYATYETRFAGTIPLPEPINVVLERAPDRGPRPER